MAWLSTGDNLEACLAADSPHEGAAELKEEMEESGVAVQTDDDPGLLPPPTILVRQLRSRLEIHNAEPTSTVVALTDLLEAHPAFVQLLAKNPELRSVIENGVQELLPRDSEERPSAARQDQSYAMARARVLWTICTCVWQGTAVMLEGLRKKMPGASASQSEQLRVLMQANNDLRTQHATCRRDYLRELTELRERCRRIEPLAEEALMKLLQEEPVMFFEPLDFVLDDTTKQFICDTVEEKLRLLTLKGWGKIRIQTEEEKASANRINELEAELATIRTESASTSAHASLPWIDLDVCSSASEVDAASTRCSTACSISATSGFGGLDNCPKCSSVQSKVATLCARLQELVGDQAMKEALSYAGMSEDVVKKSKASKARKETAFDRLFADARRRETAKGRVAKMQNDAKEIHALQAEELRSCLLAAKTGPAKKKVELVKGMHSKSVASAVALHKAFDRFHSKNCSAIDGQDEDGECSASTSVPSSGRTSSQACFRSFEAAQAVSDSPDPTEGCPEGRWSALLSDEIYCAEVQGITQAPCEPEVVSLAKDRPARADKIGCSRMQKLRDRAAEIHALEAAELAHCISAGFGESVKDEVEHLKTLHAQSVTLASVMQDALDTLHEDVIDSSGKEDQLHDNFVDCPLVKDKSHVSTAQSRGYKVTSACDDTVPENTLASLGSPERRKGSKKDSSASQDHKRLVPKMQTSLSALDQPSVVDKELPALPHSRSPDKKKTFPKPMDEYYLPQCNSPEKSKGTLSPSGLGGQSLLPISGAPHSASPDKKKHSASPEKKRAPLSPSGLGGHSLFPSSALSHSVSPDKKKHSTSPERKRAPLSPSGLGGHSLFPSSGLSHSVSPEKKKHSASPEKKKAPSSLAAFDEPVSLIPGRSHSNSPLKKKKQTGVAGAQLDPLEHIFRPIAPLRELSRGPLAGQLPFAGGLVREKECEFLCCPASLKQSGSSPNLGSVGACGVGNASLGDAPQAGRQEQEHVRHCMRKSEPLPALSRVVATPTPVGPS